jgi:hypothetical protein
MADLVRRIGITAKQVDALATADLHQADDGSWVRVAGVITHRQRPATASGVTFINLEDETGMSNIVVSIGSLDRQRQNRPHRSCSHRHRPSPTHGPSSQPQRRTTPTPPARRQNQIPRLPLTATSAVAGECVAPNRAL